MFSGLNNFCLQTMASQFSTDYEQLCTADFEVLDVSTATAVQRKRLCEIGVEVGVGVGVCHAHALYLGQIMVEIKIVDPDLCSEIKGMCRPMKNANDPVTKHVEKKLRECILTDQGGRPPAKFTFTIQADNITSKEYAELAELTAEQKIEQQKKDNIVYDRREALGEVRSQEEYSALLLQRVFRRHKCMKELRARLEDTWHKTWDDDSKRYYYQNMVDGSSQWDAPLLLHGHDLTTASRAHHVIKRLR